jgi:hypothetical protein
MTPIALESPPFPEELEFVWATFLELNSTRGVGMSGPLPLSYQEMKAWLELTGEVLTPYEVEAIKRIDKVYMKVIN